MPAFYGLGVVWDPTVPHDDALTKVVFGLGTAQVVILPEGTPTGDAKVLDMRRTMGVSAHLFSAGVAAPRVRVNLLNSQVDIEIWPVEMIGTLQFDVYHLPDACFLKPWKVRER